MGVSSEAGYGLVTELHTVHRGYSQALPDGCSTWNVDRVCRVEESSSASTVYLVLLCWVVAKQLAKEKAKTGTMVVRAGRREDMMSLSVISYVTRS